jgi:hypothetical protein
MAFCTFAYFYFPQIFVIPAKAGIQPIVISTTYQVLDPGLRRDDGFLEVPFWRLPLPEDSVIPDLVLALIFNVTE